MFQKKSCFDFLEEGVNILRKRIKRLPFRKTLGKRSRRIKVPLRRRKKSHKRATIETLGKRASGSICFSIVLNEMKFKLIFQKSKSKVNL